MNTSPTRWLPYGIVIVLVIAAAVGLLLRHRTSPTPATPAVSTSPSASQATATDAVTLQNFAFSPAVITVKVGTKVTWTNQDDVSHTVTDDQSGNGPDSQLFGRDATYSYVFQTAGTYTYHCAPHPYMHGTVIVTQ